MADSADFTRMVPGFDFLQGLLKSASLPGMGSWIAPTLDPEELEKRIGELRTVQFWLEQNARLLGATIQALEVQRMTLSTLKTLNLPIADFTEALRMKPPEAAPPPAAPVPTPEPEPELDSAPAAPEAPAAAGVVDPLQWWGALTQQFTELATHALQEGSAEAARNLAGAMARPAADNAGQVPESAVPARAAAKPAKPAKPAAAPRRRI